MGILVVQSVKATGTTPFGTPAMATSHGNLLVAAVGGSFVQQDPSLTDSDGNLWAYVNGWSTISGAVALFQAKNIAGGGSTAVTLHMPSPTVMSLAVMEISGVSPGSGMSGSNAQVQPGGTGPPRSSGVVSAGGGETILVGAASSYALANNAYTQGATYTLDQEYDNVAFGQPGVILAHRIVLVPGSYDFDFTLSDNTVNSVGVVGASPAGSGAAPGEGGGDSFLVTWGRW